MNDRKHPKNYQVKFSSSVDWEDADILTDFSFPWLEKEAPRTEFRALWNGADFHFRFDVEDRDLVLDESGEPDRAVLGSDRVEIFFSPTAELSEPYYGIEMEPRGGAYDYQGIYHRKFSPQWKMPGLEFLGKIREGDGYSVTGKIPVETLQELRCLTDGEAVAGVYRAEFSHLPDGSIREDWISWVDPETVTPDFHVPSSFGRFIFNPNHG